MKAVRLLPLVLCLGASGPMTPTQSTVASTAGAPLNGALQQLSPADTLDLPARTRGARAAPVTVYEFSDFQCSHCRRFALQTYPQLDSIYVRTGRVRWVFLNVMSPRHENAASAARFALCAAEQFKFWEMHDLLFEHQEEWTALDRPHEVFYSLAEEAEIDGPTLAECVARQEAAEQVLSYERGLAVEWGIRGVPALVVDGTMIAQGARPLPEFTAVLDSVLAESTAGDAKDWR